MVAQLEEENCALGLNRWTRCRGKSKGANQMAVFHEPLCEPQLESQTILLAVVKQASKRIKELLVVLRQTNTEAAMICRAARRRLSTSTTPLAANRRSLLVCDARSALGGLRDGVRVPSSIAEVVATKQVSSKR